ncbi:MAG: phytoene desaturase family protein [Egibacteraceae bacterium]
MYDAVVVGSGPNGLAAAITIAETGRSVLVLEAQDSVGGGVRSAQLTLPGFNHDICSAIYPLVEGTPFLSRLPLERYGLELIHPPVPLAHPLDGGRAAVLERSVEDTAVGLDGDADAYRALMKPLVTGWEGISAGILGPPRLPRHPLALARFGWHAVRSATALATGEFQHEAARALFAGMAAHSFLPLERSPSAAYGLVLGVLAHVAGWPLVKGGAQRLADALARHLAGLGGTVVTGRRVRRLSDVPPARAVLLDVTPRQLVRIAGDRLPAGYRRGLERYRYGPGAFKVDWALDGPVPWTAQACRRAGTVHLGGALAEIAASERDVAEGRHPERPYVLIAQQSLFDPTRAPEGSHTLWGYCHVPNGSTVDMTERIEAQVERFAPGFRDRVLARNVRPPAALERHNANCVGGDINGGLGDWRQLFTRPVPRLVPYATPVDGLYLCSSSTPPGGGVHGLCGHYAARAALRRSLR